MNNTDLIQYSNINNIFDDSILTIFILIVPGFFVVMCVTGCIFYTFL